MTQVFPNKVFAALLLLASTASSMADVLILADGSANGQWYNSSRNGEGLFVEIIDTRDPIQISIAWFTYDENGNQMWLMGNVPLDETQTRVTVPLFHFEGAVFGAGFDPDDIERTEWGEITIHFPDCNRARATYTSEVGFPSGTLNLTRLTNLQQVECLGPPPVEPVTPGTWRSTTQDVCLNVDDNGVLVTSEDNSECPGDAAFDADLNGSLPDGGSCTVTVRCGGTWSIDNRGNFFCLAENAVVSGNFADEDSVSGEVLEGGGEEDACLASWSAVPEG